jgi:hypothetical protein
MGNIAFSKIFVSLYRVSQEERSIFWEVIVKVIVSKTVYIYTCVLF